MQHKATHVKLTDELLDKKRVVADTEVFVRDTVITGFAVKLYPSGRKAFIVERRLGDSKRWKRLTIGTFPEWSVEEARAKAIAWHRKLSEGIDPKEEEVKERTLALAEKAKQEVNNEKVESKEALLNLTLHELLEDVYLGGDKKYLNSRPLKERTINDMRKIWSASFADWRDKPIRELTARVIKERWQKIAIAENHHTTAVKAMKYLRACFNKLMDERLIDYPDDPLFVNNPVTVAIKSKQLHKSQVPELKTYLDPKEISIFCEFLNLEGENIAGALQDNFLAVRDKIYFFMLLQYGLRSSEALSLPWRDVDFGEGEGKGEMTFRNTKNSLDHVVPISKKMHYILDSWKGIVLSRNPACKWVFPNTKLTGKIASPPRETLEKLKEYVGKKFSSHDLRRTFNMCVKDPEILNQDDAVAQRLLNHTPTSTNINEKNYTFLNPVRYRYLYDQLWLFFKHPEVGVASKKVVEEFDYWELLATLDEEKFAWDRLPTNRSKPLLTQLPNNHDVQKEHQRWLQTSYSNSIAQPDAKRLT
jgi:integrase